MSEASIWEQTAVLLDEAASLVLDDVPAEPARRPGQSPAEFESTEFVRMFDNDRPATWIRELSGTYITEVGHELRALAHLLRFGCVAGSIEVLVRAAMERVGRSNWVLDADESVDARRRAVRASFETLVSFQRYRIGVEMIRADKEGPATSGEGYAGQACTGGIVVRRD